MAAIVNYDAERSVLGAIVLENSLLRPKLALQAEHFGFDSHRKIYLRILDLDSAGVPIDLITLTDKLHKTGELDAVGGVGYLSSLMDGVIATKDSLEHHARIIRQNAAKSHISRITQSVYERIQSDPAATISELRDCLLAIEQGAGIFDEGSVCIRTLADIPDPFSLTVEDVEWLVEGLFPARGITVLAGEAGAGKTWLAMVLARAATIGGDFLGRAVQRMEVLYLDRENPLSLVRSRLEIICGPGVLRPWGSWCSEEPPLIGDPLLVEFAKQGPLIVFDSLIRFHSADENSASEMSRVMGQLRALATAGATVVVLHHKAKTETSSYRGSSDIVAGADAVFALAKREDLLELRTVKNRFAAEVTVAIKPDFGHAAFVVVDSPSITQKRDDLAAISQAIETNPGMSQSQIIETLHTGRTVTCKLLKAHENRLWRVEKGANGALRYFPCTEYRPVPSTPSTSELTCTAVPTPLGVVQSTAIPQEQTI